MPVHCSKQGDKWRIMGPNGDVETTSKGTAVDGGGHPTESACMRQAAAINRSLHTRNAQRVARLGQDVYAMPEFQMLLNKLGIPLSNYASITITLRRDELVRILLEEEEEPLSPPMD